MIINNEQSSSLTSHVGLFTTETWFHGWFSDGPWNLRRTLQLFGSKCHFGLWLFLWDYDSINGVITCWNWLIPIPSSGHNCRAVTGIAPIRGRFKGDDRHGCHATWLPSGSRSPKSVKIAALFSCCRLDTMLPSMTLSGWWFQSIFIFHHGIILPID